MSLDERTRNEISELVGNNRVVLFMKGTRHFPQCGFSATVVQILNELVPEYQTVNVLKSPEMRDGIKEYSSWPTIPQLYVDGKFVGGCDIVREMYVAGELQQMFGVQEEVKPPRVQLTPSARKAIEDARREDDQGSLRLGVSTRFDHELSLDEARPGDFEVDAGGITVLVDRMSAKRADGVTIDFVAEGEGGFRVENPNEPPRVRPLRPADLKRMLEAGDKPRLIDVRTEQEYAIAKLPGGRLLDQTSDELEALDRSSPLVFFCHHGGRSRAAAERFVAQGFTRVYNLEGGIDAWSREVDPSVPQY
jgi:monothiol glutaredoxin